jgi:hypothetical protein
MAAKPIIKKRRVEGSGVGVVGVVGGVGCGKGPEGGGERDQSAEPASSVAVPWMAWQLSGNKE